MPSVAVQQLPSRVAHRNDLFQVDFLIISAPVFQTLPKVARSWLAFYVALVKLGFCRVVAPMAAINDAHRQAGANNSSLRSAWRAHAELERLGFITRKTLHLGENSIQSDIEIVAEKFKFFILCDKNLHVPKSHPSYSSSNSDQAIKSNLESKIQSGDREPKREQEPEKKRAWINPVIYTLGVVLRGEKKGLREATMAKAALALCVGGMLSDWTPARWWAMGHEEREYCARAILLPALHSQVFSMFANNAPKKQIQKQNPAQPYRNTVKAPLGFSDLDAGTLAEFRKISGEPKEFSPCVEENLLTAQELAILSTAKSKARIFTDGT